MNPPNSELVAVSWLRQRVPGLAEGQVATTLPEDISKWPDGFVQVQGLPGGRATGEVDRLAVRHPVMQLDFWAPSTTGGKPRWGHAARLFELVLAATELQAYGQAVTLPEGYSGARVLGVYFVGTDPTRVPGDPSGYARYTADLALDWVRAAA